ncbi:hypothetical protein [Leptospira borgpetersenii]|uniref:Uncharacterized protein n=1 Tax=Leptospira borgpetersenii serovar Ballum TaxID=280505 RepID=A0A0S2ITF0_LEPBO|nr:hypothetical protein [Leptospira borgpetersenii]EKQ99251.1 hypothetical protein LEP1GSC121_2704 [Leptospira borgpetersenii serovar Castellonis str. 200801910]EMO10700.1 hypothetical protein LEP1GSC137_3922 [Leptospira borgpetersenii str. Noumea 25]ALO26940.1 hypothetical protein LBBP_02717 [Leptospira borgpetersenii serovar Ballum]MBE8164615.1 hypothetical protein [Leptospira borgpetersenii serovar Ballum]MBE8195999.1 hypothetical protein [Leptospira borgpetersenii serovar Ballum]
MIGIDVLSKDEVFLRQLLISGSLDRRSLMQTDTISLPEPTRESLLQL